MGNGFSRNMHVIGGGSCTTNVTRINGTTRNNRPPSLTKIDCELLRRSWLIMAPDDTSQWENLYGLGIEIYDEIFRSNRDVMNFFPTLLEASRRSMDITELRNIAAFRNQALRLVDVIARAVDSCENIGKLEPHLRDLGRRHRMYVNGLTDNHFRCVQQSTLIIIRAKLGQYCNGSSGSNLEGYTIEQIMKAWSSLMGLIIFYIHDGYQTDK